jgi:hypothetical protein
MTTTISCETIAEQVGALFTCSQVNQYIRIRTPLLYPDGDVIDLFVRQTADTLVLSDLGETLRWLRMQTTTPRRSKKQDGLIADVTTNHNVELYRGMLMVRVQDLSQLGVQVMRLAQAALRVSDLWFTMRNQNVETISDEVQVFLTEHKISHERDKRVIGRSARNWSIDFHTFHPARSAYVAVLTTASSAAVQTLTNNAVARWIDLANYQATQNIRFISLFDDSSDVWREMNFRQLEEVSEVVFWSQPHQFLEKLTV